MINRLSNPINRNRLAAKISKVMSSNDHALQSRFYGKIWPQSTQIWLGFFSSGSYFILGHPVIVLPCPKLAVSLNMVMLILEGHDLEHTNSFQAC